LVIKTSVLFIINSIVITGMEIIMDVESKSILVKVPLETYRRMKTVQTKRLLEALHHNGDKKIRLDEMALEAIEEKYADKLEETS
jgi:hypothetical protein